MSLHLIPSEFPYIWGKLYFIFYQFSHTGPPGYIGWTRFQPMQTGGPVRLLCWAGLADCKVRLKLPPLFRRGGSENRWDSWQGAADRQAGPVHQLHLHCQRQDQGKELNPSPWVSSHVIEVFLASEIRVKTLLCRWGQGPTALSMSAPLLKEVSIS
jgi:hypothetical protein